MPHKSAKFTPMVQIAAQNSSSPCCSNLRGQLISAAKGKHASGSRDSPPRKHMDHWTSMQRWNHEDQHPGGAETEISTGVEECERQQRLHRYSSNKREAKDTVSSLLDRDGEGEMMKCTEKREVLNVFFASSSQISSPVSHTPEAMLWGKKHYQSQTN